MPTKPSPYHLRFVSHPILGGFVAVESCEDDEMPSPPSPAEAIEVPFTISPSTNKEAGTSSVDPSIPPVQNRSLGDRLRRPLPFGRRDPTREQMRAALHEALQEHQRYLNDLIAARRAQREHQRRPSSPLPPDATTESDPTDL